MMIPKHAPVPSLVMTWRSAAVALVFALVSAGAAPVNAAQLPGVVMDDADATLTGSWTASTSVKPYVGTGYIHAKGPGSTATFTLVPAAAGTYHVRLAYTANGNREARVPVTVAVAGKQKKTFHIDQRKAAEDPAGFHDLGQFELTADQPVEVTITTQGTSDYVIVDAAQLLTPAELKASLKPRPVAKAKAEADAPKPPEPDPAPPFSRTPPTRAVRKLSLAELESLLAPHIGEAQRVDDDLFLRRASLDLVGRQPTHDQMQAFLADASKDKRAAAVDRLLASPQFGRNWANYWSDVIGYRQQEPELTFYDYAPFKTWLAEQLNTGQGWDAIVYRMLTAQGKVGQHPAATYIGFHQGNQSRLAGETTRVFMGVQIACAECHDHPFVPTMKQRMFHGIAAFFARTDVKIPQLDGDNIEVKAKDKGEHKVPGAKEAIAPTTLAGQALELGAADAQRRTALANWIVSGDNVYFARAHVNRVWSRLMGRGFVEPIDDLGQGAASDRVMAEVFDALSSHFAASGFDVKDLFRLIMATRAYQRRMVGDSAADLAKVATTKQLRGDEVFDSLAVGVALPNVTPQRQKKTGAVRFPPPPKSTRDLVNDAFGFDPSLRDQDAPRTMKQAMFMMNNDQLQAQIDARPASGTMLARLLAEEPDDAVAVTKLFQRVLARRPTERERKIMLDYIAAESGSGAGQRGQAFEDVLWSLVNTAEFTTRR